MLPPLAAALTCPPPPTPPPLNRQVGDKIESVKVVSGAENLVQPKS